MPPRKRKPAATAKKPRGPDPELLAFVAARVDVVLRLRLDGAQLHDVLGFANDAGAEADLARGGPPWGIDEAAAWALIGRADDLLVARAHVTHERAAALAIAQRDALYARAVNAGDYPAALAVLKDKAQLLGMYPNVAELRQLVKDQDRALQQLEADRAVPALGPAEDGEAPAREADGEADPAPHEGQGGG